MPLPNDTSYTEDETVYIARSNRQQQINLSTSRQNAKLIDTPQQKTSEDASKDDTDVLEPTGGNSKGAENKTPKKGLFGWLRR